jgi:hypothetical protein
MSENATCHCDDPRGEGFKLWLCGSALCKAITRKSYRNGYDYLDDNKRTVIIAEELKS